MLIALVVMAGVLLLAMVVNNRRQPSRWESGWDSGNTGNGSAWEWGGGSGGESGGGSGGDSGGDCGGDTGGCDAGGGGGD